MRAMKHPPQRIKNVYAKKLRYVRDLIPQLHTTSLKVEKKTKLWYNKAITRHKKQILCIGLGNDYVIRPLEQRNTRSKIYGLI